MGRPRPLFTIFWFFSNTNFTEKAVYFSGIQTPIIGAEGGHADHLTTTTHGQFQTILFGHLGLQFDSWPAGTIE